MNIPLIVAATAVITASVTALIVGLLTAAAREDALVRRLRAATGEDQLLETHGGRHTEEAPPGERRPVIRLTPPSR